MVLSRIAKRVCYIKVNNSSQQEVLSCCFFHHVPSNINKLWLLLCYLRVPFHQLASPPAFHVTHIPKGNVEYDIYVYLVAEVRGTCSGGSKSKVNTGRPSEHVEPSRSIQTHVQVNKMSDRSCDIYFLECHQCNKISNFLNVINVTRHYLVMERYFPDTNLREMRSLLVQ